MMSDAAFESWTDDQGLLQVGADGPTLQYSTDMEYGEYDFVLAGVVEGGSLHMVNVEHMTGEVVRSVAPGETVMMRVLPSEGSTSLVCVYN